LPQTQTWLDRQIRALPPAFRQRIVADTAEHLDLFPAEDLWVFTRVGRLRRFWDKGLKRLGLRTDFGFVDQAARSFRPQVVHSHFGHVGWAMGSLSQRLGAAHVVSFYGFDVNMLPQRDPRWRKRYAQMFRAVDRVLCEGPHMAQCLIAMDCPPERCRVHHLGVDLPAIAFRPRTLPEGEPLRVLMAASFREKKGFSDGLEALARVRRHHPVAITLVGDAGRDAASQAEKARILAMLERTGLAPHTRLLGFQPPAVLWREAYDHHLFLAPSRTASDGDTEGGAPVVLIEMVASGMAAVATRHCDIPHVLPATWADRLAPEGDVDALAAAIEAWIAAPAAQWSERLAQGRAHLDAGFDAASQGQALAAIYRELARGKGWAGR
jgi:colanic acid/amylovoran biosynthesis glycosyltransferase